MSTPGSHTSCSRPSPEPDAPETQAEAVAARLFVAAPGTLTTVIPMELDADRNLLEPLSETSGAAKKRAKKKAAAAAGGDGGAAAAETTAAAPAEEAAAAPT